MATAITAAIAPLRHELGAATNQALLSASRRLRRLRDAAQRSPHLSQLVPILTGTAARLALLSRTVAGHHPSRLSRLDTRLALEVLTQQANALSTQRTHAHRRRR
jgi:hypothetical protein